MNLMNNIKLPIYEIYDFIKDYFGEYSEEEIIKVIEAHWIYGTIDAVYKDGKIIAVCRWNIIAAGKVCDVLDLVIKPGEDGFKIMKHLIARNWHRFPAVKYIKFFRNRKYGWTKPRMYRIRDILHLRRVI